MKIQFKTIDTIDWFTRLQSKPVCRFVQIDICNYYSSVTEIVLNKILMFARNTVYMTKSEIDRVKLDRKSVLEVENKIVRMLLIYLWRGRFSTGNWH